jgi:hypothetical protein
MVIDGEVSCDKQTEFLDLKILPDIWPYNDVGFRKGVTYFYEIQHDTYSIMR